jgi:threonine synthase
MPEAFGVPGGPPGPPGHSFACAACGAGSGVEQAAWRCACGGPLELAEAAPFSRAAIDDAEPSFWRYARALPPLDPRHRVRLGEAVTPLLALELPAGRAVLKLDYLFPTGSYKDRGLAVLVSWLRSLRIRSVVEDSSGNAGAALAAYTAAAGIECTIYVPASNSPGKLAQAAAYGAELVPIAGDRAAVADAALRAAATRFYASHNRCPMFLAGVATLGFELVEQLGWRAPDHVVVPAGYGSLVLGLHWAFRALVAGGVLGGLPRLHAVQTAAYPALAAAWAGGADEVDARGGGPTLAEGIACRRPLRGRALLRAIRESRGTVTSVGDDETLEALRALVRRGVYVEPTSAVAAAGHARLATDGTIAPTETVVVVLTGSGLKAATTIGDLLAGRRG